MVKLRCECITLLLYFAFNAFSLLELFAEPFIDSGILDSVLPLALVRPLLLFGSTGNQLPLDPAQHLRLLLHLHDPLIDPPFDLLPVPLDPLGLPHPQFLLHIELVLSLLRLVYCFEAFRLHFHDFVVEGQHLCVDVREFGDLHSQGVDQGLLFGEGHLGALGARTTLHTFGKEINNYATYRTFPKRKSNFIR